MDALLRLLSTVNIISSKEFWQMNLEGKPREKSVFTTPDGLYEFTVLPLGLKNTLVCYCLYRWYHYCIFSKNLEDHVQHLWQVLEATERAGLTIKASKCQFGMEEVIHLWHKVGSGKIAPLEDKRKAIKDWPVPETKKQVQAFLGIASYYRRFICNLGSIVGPLSELLEKNLNKIKWDQAWQTAFNKVKLWLSHTYWSRRISASHLLFWPQTHQKKALEIFVAQCEWTETPSGLL